MNKLAFIDLETTGLDPQVNGIIQIAGRIVVGASSAPFDIRTRPCDGDKVDGAALEANNIQVEDLAQRDSPQLTHRKLLQILEEHVDKFNPRDKLWFIGYNANFDYQFLRAWFLKLGDKYFGSWFFHPPLDVMTLAGVHLMNERRDMSNFKLATVAAQFGIVVDDERLHDAAYDIELTYELWKALGNH